MAIKTIFVAGASGYIGGAVVRNAVAQGYSVRGLSRSELSDEKILAMGATPVRGNFDTLDVFAREAASADAVCFLADAFNGSGWKLPFDEVSKIHNRAIDAVAGAMEGTGKPLVVSGGALIVTAREDGEETTEDDPDDKTAFVDRSIITNHALSWKAKGVNASVIQLAPWVYGNAGSGVALLVSMFSDAGAGLIVDGGKNRTSFVHVEDAARMYLLAAEAGDAAGGHRFNCVSDTTVTYAQLVEAVASKLDIETVQVTLEEAGKKIGPFFADFLQAPCRANSDKAKIILGWKPTEATVLDDINSGSYAAVAEGLKKAKAMAA
jgi:nucleoside-diphosphate-sugar epimerase